MDDANQDFLYRNTNRVDVAQIMAEEYFTSKNIFWRTLGSDPKDDNPIPMDMFFKMPPFIQKMPDMFAISPTQFVFVEVKGCKDSLKVKLSDWTQYIRWNDIARFMFFVYSAANEKKFLFYLEDFHMMLDTSTVGKYRDNNKVYWEIPIIELEPYIILQ
jgi:hypothetical protein